MRGVDVKKLQTILAKDKSIYPERITTGYFGPATKRAVKRFQDRYHLATPAQKKTANYGAVGVKTMEKLTEWAR
jgi:peptidoglycan hydrolase-like protein with peptidoglycan-binding domain